MHACRGGGMGIQRLGEMPTDTGAQTGCVCLSKYRIDRHTGVHAHADAPNTIRAEGDAN